MRIVMVTAAAALVCLSSCKSLRIHREEPEKAVTAMALAIGLNRLDPAHYTNKLDPLYGCENDAAAMMQVAQAQGFSASMLRSKEATKAAVRKKILEAAAILKDGDIFVLSYSGHGNVIWDSSNDEKDAVDETLCLYDGQMVDDELAEFWTHFAKGVRIVAFFDSCHSGTAPTAPLDFRAAGQPLDRFPPTYPPHAHIHPVVAPLGGPMFEEGFLWRFFFPESTLAVIKEEDDNKAMGDKLLPGEIADAISDMPENKRLGRNVPPERESRARTRASLLSISACQDGELTQDGIINSIFTRALLKTWDGGNFKGSYRSFHRAITRRLESQRPNFFRHGARKLSFEWERPWTK